MASDFTWNVYSSDGAYSCPATCYWERTKELEGGGHFYYFVVEMDDTFSNMLSQAQGKSIRFGSEVGDTSTHSFATPTYETLALCARATQTVNDETLEVSRFGYMTLSSATQDLTININGNLVTHNAYYSTLSGSEIYYNLGIGTLFSFNTNGSVSNNAAIWLLNVAPAVIVRDKEGHVTYCGTTLNYNISTPCSYSTVQSLSAPSSSGYGNVSALESLDVLNYTWSSGTNLFYALTNSDLIKLNYDNSLKLFDGIKIDGDAVDPDDGDDDDGDNANTDDTTPDTPDVPNSPPLFTLHAVTDTALNSVMQKVFDSAGLLASIKNFFGTGVTITPSSLMETIIGCIQIGFKGISETTTSNINLGFYDTEVSAPVIGQFAYFTYGEVTIPTKTYSTDANSGKANFYNADGHRNIYIHVPFCGIHQLDPSEVYGKKLRLTGMVSTTTGQVTDYLSVVEDSGTKLIATYSGNAGISMPVTSIDSSNITSGLLSAGLAVAVGVATGGIGGAITGTAAMSAAELTGTTATGLEAMEITQTASQTASTIGTIGNGIGSAVQNAMQPPSVPHSGGLGGGATANDIQMAYVMIEDLNVVGRSSGFRDTLGLPSGKSGKLSSLTNTGDYAQISAVNLGISGATSEEIEYAKQLLVSGVII